MIMRYYINISCICLNLATRVHSVELVAIVSMLAMRLTSGLAGSFGYFPMP